MRYGGLAVTTLLWQQHLIGILKVMKPPATADCHRSLSSVNHWQTAMTRSVAYRRIANARLPIIVPLWHFHVLSHSFLLLIFLHLSVFIYRKRFSLRNQLLQNIIQLH